MAFSLRQFEIFAQVAKFGHVTRASERLLLSQSAVSTAIAEMERTAGGILFDRHGKKLVLNDRGRRILPEIREILNKVADLEMFLHESTSEPIGVLQVGASTTIGNYLLPRIVGQFSRQHPRARALLFVENTERIERAVITGEYDLGLIEGPSHSSSLTVTPWREDELVIIVGKEHPWAKTGKADDDVLESAPWIMREKGSGTREVFETAMAARGIRYRIDMELGHTEAIKKAVEAGLGIGCLSRMAVQRELDQGWLVAVDASVNLQRTLSILTRKDAARTILMEAWLSQLAANR